MFITCFESYAIIHLIVHALMEQLIRKIRQIEKGDRKMTLYLILQGVFTGIFLASMELTANVLFLQSQDPDRIPLAFMISGGVGILITTIFSYFSKQVGVRIFGILNMVAILIMSLSLLPLSRILSGETFHFILFVLAGPLVLISVLGFWTSFRGFLPPTKVKQLSGIVEMGVIGGMVLAFAGIPLSAYAGMEISRLLYLSAGSLILALIAHLLTLKETRSGIPYRGRKVQSSGPIALISHRYTALMAAFALLGISALVVVHYGFLRVADARFPDASDLAILFGFIFAGMISLTFVLKKLVFERMKMKFGAGATMLMAPALLLLVTVASAIAGESWAFANDGRYFAWFFVFVVLSRFLTGTLRGSMEEPSMELVYQTLDPRYRYNVQSGIEGMLSQAGVFAIGLFLACFIMISFVEFIHVMYLQFVLAVAWFFVGYALYRSYRRILEVTLGSDRIREHTDQKLEEIVRSELESTAFPMEVMEFNPYFFHFTSREKLMILLGHNHPGVRRRIWDHLLQSSPGLPDLTLSQLMVRESEPTVRERIRQLGQRRLRNRPGLQEAFIRERLDRFTDQKQATDPSLEEAFRSGVKNEVIAALYHVAEKKDRKYIPELITLLRDRDTQVRSVAISTAALLEARGIGTQLIEFMNDPHLYAPAWSALIQQGERIIEELQAGFHRHGAEIKLQKRILSVAAAIGGERAMQFLLEKLDYHQREIFLEVVTGLYENNYEATDLTRPAIENAILRQVQTGTWDLVALTSLKCEEYERTISLSLEHELREVNRVIMMLLALLYERRSVHRIRKTLTERVSEERGVAIELINLLVSEPLKTVLVSYFEDVSIREKPDRLRQLFDTDLIPSGLLLKKILNRDGMQMGDFIRVCVLQAMGRSPHHFDHQQILAQGFHPNPRIRETAAQIIRKNDPERYSMNTGRLDFPDNHFPGHEDAAGWFIDTTMRLSAWKLFGNVGINSLFRLVSALIPVTGEIPSGEDTVVLARSLSASDFTPLSSGIAIIAAHHPEILEQIRYLGTDRKCEVYCIDKGEFIELMFDDRSLLHAFCTFLNQTSVHLV